MGTRIQEIATSNGWTGESADVDSDEYDDATEEAADYLAELPGIPDGCRPYWGI